MDMSKGRLLIDMINFASCINDAVGVCFDCGGGGSYSFFPTKKRKWMPIVESLLL